MRHYYGTVRFTPHPTWLLHIVDGAVVKISQVAPHERDPEVRELRPGLLGIRCQGRTVDDAIINATLHEMAYRREHAPQKVT